MPFLSKGIIEVPHISGTMIMKFSYTIAYNTMAYRCGYLLIPNDHPWYGKHYRDRELDCFRAHGGLTFSASLLDFGDWWLGFDCGHCGDAPDPALAPIGYITPSFIKAEGGVIRSDKYVYSELEDMAEQAASAALNPSCLDDWCATLLELIQIQT